MKEAMRALGDDMTEQPPSAEALSIAEDIANNCMFEKVGARAIDALIAQRVSAETERWQKRWQNRDRQRLAQICRLQETAQSFQNAQAARPAPQQRHLTGGEREVLHKALLASSRLVHSGGEQDSDPAHQPSTRVVDYTERARELLGKLHCWRLLYHDARPIDDPDVGVIAAALSAVASERDAAAMGPNPFRASLLARMQEIQGQQPSESSVPSALASTGEHPAQESDVQRLKREGRLAPFPAAVADYTEQARACIPEAVWALAANRPYRGLRFEEVVQIRNNVAAALSAVASERDAAAIRAFGQRVWSDTEEVAYQAGAKDAHAALRAEYLDVLRGVGVTEDPELVAALSERGREYEAETRAALLERLREPEVREAVAKATWDKKTAVRWDQATAVMRDRELVCADAALTKIAEMLK